MYQFCLSSAAPITMFYKFKPKVGSRKLDKVYCD